MSTDVTSGFVPTSLGRRSVALAVSGALLLAGCTTQSQRIGADDGSDVCRPQRVALDSTGNYFGEDLVKGVAIGAVGGALIGGLATGNARGAIAGALAGGAAGAAVGYWQAKVQQEKDQASLLRGIAADLTRENDSIDKTQLAFNQLIDCRKGEASRIRGELTAGRLTRPQAETAMAGVRQRYEQDIKIAQAISDKVQDRGANFLYANEQVNGPLPSAAAAPAPARVASAPAPTTGNAARPAQAQARPTQNRPAPAPTTAQRQTPATANDRSSVQTATATNLAKRDQLTQSVQVAQSNQSAFDLSAG